MDYNDVFKQGVAKSNESKYEEAVEIFEKCLDIVPKNTLHVVHHNIGFCYKKMNNFKLSEKYLRLACKKTNYDSPRMSLMELYIKNNMFFEGYKYYDWSYVWEGSFHYDYETSKEKRLDWEDPNTKIPLCVRFKKPIPKVKELNNKQLKKLYEDSLKKIEGKIIHIYGTQGLGDQIQCSRLIFDLQKYKPKKIILSCRPELMKLLYSLIDVMPNVEIRYTKLESTEFDYFTTSFGLMKLLQKNHDATNGWLSYDKRDLYYYKNMLMEELIDRGFNKIKIEKIQGINWRGNPKHPNDKKRSLSIRDLIFRCDLNQPIVSFQFQPTQEEKEIMHKFNIIDASKYFNNLYELGAFLKNISILYSVDSAPIHVAGSSNIPALIFMKRGEEDYRWGIKETEKIYKSTRIIRY